MSAEHEDLLRGIVTDAALEEFCRRWMIAELWAFGSILREDFGPESDIDLLVSYAPEARRSLLAHAQMERELEQLTGRSVDVFSRTAVEATHNWIRRREILGTARKVYDASAAQTVPG